MTAAGGAASLPLREKLNVGDLVVQGPVEDLECVSRLGADAPADSTVCVIDVAVGFPAPGQ